MFEAHDDMKATIVSPGEDESRGLLIIAIKGSESKEDWILNFNGDPITNAYSKKVEPTSFECYNERYADPHSSSTAQQPGTKASCTLRPRWKWRS